MMRLADKTPIIGADYKRDQRGLPVLELTFASGQIARISTENQKRTWTEMGFVFLGAEFEDSVEPIRVPADEDDGRPATTLRGYTHNPLVSTLYKRFLDDQAKDRFVEGRVAMA